MRYRAALFCAFALPSLLLAIGQQAEVAPGQVTPANAAKAEATPHVAEQTFPPNGAMETAWKVEWDTVRGFGLIIKSAWFKKGPDAPWLEVIGDARVADIFVPYQPGSPRYWDTSYNFKMSVMSAADAGPFGKILTSDNGGTPEPIVVQETRDRGPIWKNNFGVRRGHAMVLWGCLHAINYRYLIEYGFQDDGCITFRMGSTGRNLQGREWLPHMHNYYWRVDINLDGKDHNTAYMMEHTETKGDNKLASETVHKLFNDGKEGGADWDPSKFSMVRVINTQKKNYRGDPMGYDLVPSRHGTSRHFGQKEENTQHDFWVTKANSDPKLMSHRKLPEIVKGGDIVDTDIVLWYGGSMFHEPHSEDGIMKDGEWFGATLVSWLGFTLRPNNVFDQTPLFPNPKDAAIPGKKKGKG